MKLKLFIVIICIAVFVAFGYFYSDWLVGSLYQPTETTLKLGTQIANVRGSKAVKTVAAGLQIPWEIAILPNEDILVTERPGTLRRVTGDGAIIKVDGVKHHGEGGLQGMTLHPNFAENQYIYLYMTTLRNDRLENRVVRYRYVDDELLEPTEVIAGIPGAKYHDGGRIEFGPDGKLYIATGDATSVGAAQDVNSLAGKILRIDDDGSIPEDNPFGNAVWSYGHRNPQGIAWDSEGRLWSTEHGRSVPKSGFDELNLIGRGLNYGWPDIQGDEERQNMLMPAVHSGPTETWAPAGMAYHNGSLFFAGLRGEALYEAELNGSEVVDMKVHYYQDFGRLRAVYLGPDNYLYLTTSNTDGRGEPRDGDDKILRVNPAALE